MSCNLEVELTAYVDGELGPTEASAVRAHLVGCADCRSTEALLRQTVQTLATLPDFEPSLGLRRSVLTEVEATPAPLGFGLSRWLRPAVLVPSGLLLASALGVCPHHARRPAGSAHRAPGRRGPGRGHELRRGGQL